MTKPHLTDQGHELLPYLVRFGRRLVHSQDIDPLYPVLRYLVRGMDQEMALWFTFLYVAWYSLPSGMAAFRLFSEPDEWKHREGKPLDIMENCVSRWPTGIERRNNRGGKVIQHIDSYLTVWDHLPGQADWYMTGLHDPHGLPSKMEANWRVLNERIQAIHGNGRWAAYKHCEVLRRVHDLPVMAPDMGMRFSSGPREGLTYFYGELEGEGDKTIAELDLRGLDLQSRLADEGLVVDIEELETILCNFKSLMKGKYYVGHDIDELQEQISQAVRAGYLHTRDATVIWEARRETLPHEYLGEVGQRWHGVQKQRMPKFRDERRILIRKPKENK